MAVLEVVGDGGIIVLKSHNLKQEEKHNFNVFSHKNRLLCTFPRNIIIAFLYIDFHPFHFPFFANTTAAI